MNHCLRCALLLAACTISSQPQAAVTIYGIMDAGFVHERGGANGSVNKITSGVGSFSRLGLRGNEKLGAGTSLIFTLEAGHRIDTGQIDSAGSIFNRQAFVGLRSDFGTLTLGRQYIPWHMALAQVADPFGTGFAAGSKNLFPDYGANVRSTNTIIYASPTTSGLGFDLAYSPGEQSGDSSAGRQIGGSLSYANGPVAIRLAYNNKHAVLTGPGGVVADGGTGTNTLFAANYDFRVAKLHLAYGRDKGVDSAPLGNTGNPYGGVAPTPSTHGNEVLIGLAVPTGAGTVLVSFMRKNDRTSYDQDASSWGIGYLHAWSRRTALYAVYGAIQNEHGAGYTVANNAESGTGDRALNLGIRHSF